MTTEQIVLAALFVVSSVLWWALFIWLIVSGRIIDLFEFVDRVIGRKRKP